MLCTLTIRDFVIVDCIELHFSAGFSVLTGETGAGKSILIDALGLVLGERGESTLIKEGAVRAEITAVFTLNEKAHAWLVEQSILVEEDTLLLRRILEQGARSKAYINGTPVTLTQLRELGSTLVDVHAQHAYQTLLQTKYQRELLDKHAGLLTESQGVAAAYIAWQEARATRINQEAHIESALAEKEALEAKIDALTQLQVTPLEWESICQEHTRLHHAATLLSGCQEILYMLSESDHALLQQTQCVAQQLNKLAEYDVVLKEIMDIVEPAHVYLQEAAIQLKKYIERVTLDPERLYRVEQRLASLHELARRFRVQPEALADYLATLTQQAQTLNQISNIAMLIEEEKKAHAHYQDLATNLSRERMRAAQDLSQAVCDAMHLLSMGAAQFFVSVVPTEPSMHGLEHIEFQVAGHVGGTLRPLAKVASGGELSRIALAISVVTSVAMDIPTLIFDEVDSGVGGAVAQTVGKLLKTLGAEHQVLCVTHLPQVASQADTHFQVSKINTAGKISSQIVLLDNTSRIEEIARMLGGVEITETTRRHAEELLIG